MKRAYNKINSQSLSKESKTASLGECLILNDNFDYPIHLDPKNKYAFQCPPNKLESTFVIFLCLAGQIELTYNMTDLILNKNEVIINHSGTIGHLNKMSDDCKFIIVAADNNIFLPASSNPNFAELWNMSISNPICSLPESVVISVVTIYNIMKGVLNETTKTLFQKEITQGFVQSMIYAILSSYTTNTENKFVNSKHATRGHEIYSNFLTLVENNFRREREIKFYADKLCLTPKYLSQVIFKESGCYAGDHIRRYVILEAKALLKSKMFSITQICDILGFNSLSFFTKYFKNATGISPKTYQAMQ